MRVSVNESGREGKSFEIDHFPFSLRLYIFFYLDNLVAIDKNITFERLRACSVIDQCVFK